MGHLMPAFSSPSNVIFTPEATFPSTVALRPSGARTCWFAPWYAWIPWNFNVGASALIAFANSTAGEPGSTPQRFCPTLISTSTSNPEILCSRMAAARAATLAFESAHTLTRAPGVAASRARRAMLPRPTTWFVMHTSMQPPATRASASLSFAAHRPQAPAATCICPITGLLWVFACGRTAIVLGRFVKTAFRFASRRSAMTSSCGVSAAVTSEPTTGLMASSTTEAAAERRRSDADLLL
mmetsp:Transcript_19256/g.36234  ORF Transcript_19256/g.36234 Transcript_19256/m.36234 type:complete len:240 (+) Transcript_19256:687-1406(+)